MRDFLLGPVDEGGGDRGRAEGTSSYEEVTTVLYSVIYFTLGIE